VFLDLLRDIFHEINTLDEFQFYPSPDYGLESHISRTEPPKRENMTTALPNLMLAIAWNPGGLHLLTAAQMERNAMPIIL
jgi:hypothetical protein